MSDIVFITFALLFGKSRGQPAKEGWKCAGSDRMLNERNGGKPAKALTRERPKTSPSNISIENVEVSNRGPRSSFSRDSISDENLLNAQMPFGSLDVNAQNLDFSTTSNLSTDSASSQSTVSAHCSLAFEILCL